MRLSRDEITQLKTSLKSLDTKAELYLFGSRTNIHAKGGDIDLLVVSSTLTKAQLRKLRLDFCRRFGEQKIDIVLDRGDFTSPFHALIKTKAVRL